MSADAAAAAEPASMLKGTPFPSNSSRKPHKNPKFEDFSLKWREFLEGDEGGQVRLVCGAKGLILLAVVAD